MASRTVMAQLKRIELCKKPLITKITKLQAKKEALEAEIASNQAVLDSLTASEKILKGEPEVPEVAEEISTNDEPVLSTLEAYEEVPAEWVDEAVNNQ